MLFLVNTIITKVVFVAKGNDSDLINDISSILMHVDISELQ